MTQHHVRITFLPPFRDFSEDRDFNVSFQLNDTFEDLVQKLVNKFGPDFKETLLNQQQQIHEWISVMINGTNISTKENSGFSHPLSHEQEIVFCAFMSGGTKERNSSKLSIYG